LPTTSRIAEQADQLRSHQNCEQGDEHACGSMGEFPDGSALMNHGEALQL
jgi:hypothetical protein